jgi:membrane AbrB-like protein
MLASAFRPEVLPSIAADWLPVSLVLAGTLLASLASGLALARLTSLDGETASLGTLPGAAAGMLAMSPSLGADSRLVALMQYARVVLVVLSATLISRFGVLPGTSGGGGSGSGIPSGPSGSWPVYALTALVAVAGAWSGRRLRLPAGALLGPLVLGSLVSELGLLRPDLPPGVPQAAYIALGFYVGLLFDSESLRRAGRVLPAVFVSILVLMAVCAGLGLALAAFTGTDPFTAYLATTPGGIDSVSIIALGSGADISLVLAVQMLRVLAVVLAGPALARRTSRLGGRR